MLSSYGAKPSALRTDLENEISRELQKQIAFAKTQYQTERRVIMHKSAEKLAGNTHNKVFTSADRRIEFSSATNFQSRNVVNMVSPQMVHTKLKADGDLDDGASIYTVEFDIPINGPTTYGRLNIESGALSDTIYYRDIAKSRSVKIYPNALDIKPSELSYFLPPSRVQEYMNDHMPGHPDIDWDTEHLHSKDQLRFPAEEAKEIYQFEER